MIAAKLADPVLAVYTGNLAKRVAVVVKAEPIGGEAIQPLVHGAPTQVQYSLVVDCPAYAEAWLKVDHFRGVEILLRILRRADQGHAACCALCQPCRAGQPGEFRHSRRHLAPVPAAVGREYVLGLYVVHQAAGNVPPLARAVMVPAEADLHGQLGVHLPVVHHVGRLVPPKRSDVPVAPVEVAGRAHHEFRQLAASEAVVLVPVLVGAATSIDPGHTRLVAALLGESREVLFVANLQRVAPPQPRQRDAAIHRLRDEAVEFVASHVGIATGIAADVDNGRDFIRALLVVRFNHRIEGPLSRVDTRVRRRAVAGDAVAKEIGHSESSPCDHHGLGVHGQRVQHTSAPVDVCGHRFSRVREGRGDVVSQRRTAHGCL